MQVFFIDLGAVPIILKTLVPRSASPWRGKICQRRASPCVTRTGLELWECQIRTAPCPVLLQKESSKFT